MHIYIIPVTWMYSDELIIEAATKELALEKAMEMPQTEGTYMENSWEINQDAIETYRLRDSRGNAILPLSKVRVYQNPEHAGPSEEATVTECQEDPIRVVSTTTAATTRFLPPMSRLCNKYTP